MLVRESESILNGFQTFELNCPTQIKSKFRFEQKGEYC